MSSVRSARALAFAMAIVGLFSGCGHTHAIEPADGGRPVHGEPATKQASIGSVSRDEKTGVPVASAPDALLKPGAARLIQERLVRAGVLREGHATEKLDGPTRAALARYQKSHDLPATGEPDGATVDKLGLKADDVFVSGR